MTLQTVAPRAMRTVALPDGEAVPALGQGTWHMGDSHAGRAAELAALQLGVDLGMTLIDTAEMYGDGAAEALVAEALGHRRDELFIVSKVLPSNADRRRLPRACADSLARLRTDRIDLYLLHWRGAVPLGETVAAMEALRKAGQIRHWGVSNFDVDDMEELVAAGGAACATNQVLYNVCRRGPEFALFPWQSARSMPPMAYSPIEQGRLPAGGALSAVAARHGLTTAQVALAWALRQQQVIAIPKSADIAHVRENRAALDIVLSAHDLAALDAAFPPPTRRVGLEML